MDEPAPPPLTELERRVLESDYDLSLSIDQAAENVRRWLRGEIEKRLRATAKPDTVEVACAVCSEPVLLSATHAEKVLRGTMQPPECFKCRRPEEAAEAEVAAAAFVAALGEQAAELAGAAASLR